MSKLFLRRLGILFASAFALALGYGGHQAIGAETAVPSANAGADYFTGVIIYASDIERSIRFYTDVMGLKTAGRVENKGQLAEILLSKSGKIFGGSVLTLQPTHGLPERSDPNRLKFGTILFMTSSNKAMAERIRAAGYEVTERDPAHLFTKDPDGHQIMIYQFEESLRQRQQ